jgi:hypothetical protein
VALNAGHGDNLDLGLVLGSLVVVAMARKKVVVPEVEIVLVNIHEVELTLAEYNPRQISEKSLGTLVDGINNFGLLEEALHARAF